MLQKSDSMGYKQVYDFEGGMADWEETGYEVERETRITDEEREGIIGTS